MINYDENSGVDTSGISALGNRVETITRAIYLAMAGIVLLFILGSILVAAIANAHKAKEERKDNTKKILWGLIALAGVVGFIVLFESINAIVKKSQQKWNNGGSSGSISYLLSKTSNLFNLNIPSLSHINLLGA